MPLPPFESNGHLPPGIHRATVDEAIDVFCIGPRRGPFADTLYALRSVSIERNASRFLVGGSFVSNEAKPDDIDVVIVFKDDSQIPARAEKLLVDAVRLDIFYCAETSPDIVNSFIKLFSTTTFGAPVGLLQIDIDTDGPVREFQEPPADTLDIVHRLYIHRDRSDLNPGRKVLVMVHGIRSHGEWYGEVSEIVSGNGWVAAPFTYGYRHASVLSNRSERDRISDAFRDHLMTLRERYDCDFSIIAHSFGSFLAANYLLGFDFPPIEIDTLILAGAILHEELDLERFRGSVYQIVNEVGPGDPWVRFARLMSLGNPLMGRAGEVGFRHVPLDEFLAQARCDIFNHGNAIKRDVVTQRWLPRLEGNMGAARRARRRAGLI